MANFGNIGLGSPLGLRFQRVHRDVDVRPVGVFVTEVPLHARRCRILGGQQPLEGVVLGAVADDKRNAVVQAVVPLDEIPRRCCIICIHRAP